MNAKERQAALREWFYADEEHGGMTVVDITRDAYVVPNPSQRIYGDQEIDVCFDDLQALVDDDEIIRNSARPVRWWYA